MKILKNIILIVLISLIFILTINNNDKLSYVSIGDGLSKGLNSNNYKIQGYSDIIKEHINKNNKLESYTNYFSNEDMRITDLINIIEQNDIDYINNKKVTIQNELKNADIITISIGMNEILYKYRVNSIDSYIYNYIDECTNDLDKLIKIIRKINKNEIYLLGYYNPTEDTNLDKFIKYANNNLINICNDYKINYINLYDTFKNNKHLIHNKNNYYPNYDGYKLIANEIIKKIR